jgi:hypothetical protein
MQKLWRWLTDWLHDPTQARASAFPCGMILMLAMILLAALLFEPLQHLMRWLYFLK